MADDDLARLDVARRLQAALDARRFADADEADIAEECLVRLMGKVRLTVMGPRPGDATDLVNFLVGADLVPQTKSNCLTRIEHGERTEAIASMRDDTSRTFEGSDIALAFEESPKLVRIRADLKPLSKLTINRATATSAMGLKKSIDFASKSTDMALWITKELVEDELDAWRAMPERVRDHGYLLIAPGHEKADAFRQTAADLFADVVEIDPLAASEARSAPGGVDRDAFAAAGGTDMVRIVKREIALITQAAIDTAELLLMRLPGETSEAQGAPEPAPETTASPEPEAAPSPKPAATPLPETETVPALEAEPVAAPEPVVAEPRSVLEPDPVRAPKPVARVETETPAAKSAKMPDASTNAAEPEDIPLAETPGSLHFRGRALRNETETVAPETDEPPAPPEAVKPARVHTRPRSVTRTKSRDTKRPATPWSLNL